MPTTCPRCGQQAIAAIHTHTSQQIAVALLYRHRCRGKVYLHEIQIHDQT